PQARARGVALDMTVPKSPPPVSADIALIERAVSNLVDNALANTPQGGEVRVRLEANSRTVRICVQDNGAGIARDELPLVTQRFYRTRRSRANNGNNSGLGLAIVDEITTLHGTPLKISSQSGRGTT